MLVAQWQSTGLIITGSRVRVQLALGGREIGEKIVYSFYIGFMLSVLLVFVVLFTMMN